MDPQGSLFTPLENDSNDPGCSFDASGYPGLEQASRRMEEDRVGAPCIHSTERRRIPLFGPEGHTESGNLSEMMMTPATFGIITS